MTGEPPVQSGSSKIFSNPTKQLWSCWGVKNDDGVFLRATIGTITYAREALEGLNNQGTLAHLDPDEKFREIILFHGKNWIVNRVHGQDNGNPLADGRSCK